MAFLFGGFITTSILLKPLNKFGLKNYFVPDNVRYFFFGIIGSVIGSGFKGISSYLSSEILITFLSVICLTVFCHHLNYLIFRRLGHYDTVTAFFSATPGGLLESIESGKKYGGDVRIITIQHFLRILIVIIIVPIFFIIFFESPKTTSSEISFRPAHDNNLEMLFLTTLVGLILAYKTALPAKYFICPLIFSAILNSTGLVSFSSPNWLLCISQLVVGIALGARLLGINLKILRKSLILSVMSAGIMLIIVFIFSSLLVKILTIPQEILFIAFVPGGVTEMSLLAVVLSSDATFVTIHHIWRIGVVVLELLVLSRLNLFKPD